jgi:long-chain acyl-CoA synthetase
MMPFQEGRLPLHIVQKPPFTIEVPGLDPVEGETTPRRHPKASKSLITRPVPEIRTTFDLLKRSADKYENEPAVGSRSLIKAHKETRKVTKIVDGEPAELDKEWMYFELSDYTYLTYSEYFTLILDLGAGLRKLGLVAHDKLHIFATTTYVT